MSTPGRPQSPEPKRCPSDIAAVLFDLDGTLVDSAPDLAGAANDMRVDRRLEPMPFAALRPMVGSGARGMLHASFGIGPDDDRFESMREDFLDRYEARLLRETNVFAGMLPVLEALERMAVPWGIVTNKVTRFSAPLVEGLGLMRRCAVLISGDSTPHTKPHPQPLLEAARRLRLAPERCIYVGDDQRDVLAGRAANMSTVAAAWGYLGLGEPIERWSADAVLAQPEELLNWLDLP
jgi:N-acetyl-D-muramate 6-phosphate phosphatase